MRVPVVILLCCVVAGGQASFLDDLTSAFKQAADGVLAAGKTVGSSLLDQLKQTGLQLASTAVGSLVEKLDQVAAGESKRDVSTILKQTGPILQELESAMGDHSASQKLLFGLALKELEHVAENMTSMDSTSIEVILHMIDDIVAGHSKASDFLLKELEQRVKTMLPHKRSLESSLGQVGDSLSAIFTPQVTPLKSVVGSVGEALKEAAAGLFTSLTHTAQGLLQHGSGHALDDLKTVVSDVFRQTLTSMQPHVNAIVQQGQ